MQKEIRGRRRRMKKEGYDYKVAKNGLYKKDLLQMAWKMLKRRGSLKPFDGHRDRKELYKK